MNPRKLAGVLFLIAACAGCSASSVSQHPGRAAADGGPDQEGPAYFSQATATGVRYAHNWVGRPCFTLEIPGGAWVLQSATSDFVLWRRGPEVLKAYLADNREDGFAVSGMNPEGILRAFVGYELDYVRPKFEISRSAPPQIDINEQGVWAHWRWEGRSGLRAGVGKAKPADQKHLISSLWIDPWVLSFDWATSQVDYPYERSAEMAGVLRSLDFHPECFAEMRTGETWPTAEPAGPEQAPPPAPATAPSDAGF